MVFGFLDHGYDESRPDSSLNLDDMRRAADFRGGHCLTHSMTTGDLRTPLRWARAHGHEFDAAPHTILKARHWCVDCLLDFANYPNLAKASPFYGQAWYVDHETDEASASHS